MEAPIIIRKLTSKVVGKLLEGDLPTIASDDPVLIWDTKTLLYRNAY